MPTRLLPLLQLVVPVGLTSSTLSVWHLHHVSVISSCFTSNRQKPTVLSSQHQQTKQPLTSFSDCKLLRQPDLFWRCMSGSSSRGYRRWGYRHDNGPHIWSRFFPAANGTRQSPIDIPLDLNANSDNPYKDKDLSQTVGSAWRSLELTFDKSSRTRLYNNGFTFQLDYFEGTNTLSGGPLKGEYTLLQLHAHWGACDTKGSEHLVNGNAYSAEFHFVYVNQEYGTPVRRAEILDEALKHEDGLTVIGVFVQLGSRNPVLDRIDIDAIANGPTVAPENPNAGVITFGNPIDPRSLMPKDLDRYWTYSGSLTTPPCLEVVTWIVMADPIECSPDQLARFRRLHNVDEEPITCNARCPMPLHDRLITPSFSLN